MLSPDASLVRLDRWLALTPEQRRGFVPLCPDLVVELASPSDEAPRGLTALRSKMAAYQANGARIGWLLIPHRTGRGGVARQRSVSAIGRTPDVGGWTGVSGSAAAAE